MALPAEGGSESGERSEVGGPARSDRAKGTAWAAARRLEVCLRPGEAVKWGWERAGAWAPGRAFKVGQ